MRRDGSIEHENRNTSVISQKHEKQPHRCGESRFHVKNKDQKI